MPHIRQTKVTTVEILWHSIIFIAIAFSVITSSLSFTYRIPFNNFILILDGLISLLFAIDTFLKIKNQKKFNLQNLFIKKNFLHLLANIIACIPFDILLHFTGLHYGNRILRLLNHLKIIKIINLMPVIYDIVILPRIIKIELSLISTIIILNWIACGWSIINPVITTDIYSYYNKSLYWAVTTLTTIGYGDITPTNNISRIYTMFIMIMGVGIYGIVIGNISRMLSIVDRHKDQAREKIHDLNLFMKHYNIPEHLQNDVFNYYNHFFKKNIGNNDSSIVSELPSFLKSELMTYMNMNMIGNVPAFKACSHACLKEVVSALKQEFFLPNSPIINKKEKLSDMFIIAHGSVNVITKNNKNYSLQSGQTFGEESLLNENAIGKMDVSANAYCDLYKLSRQSFIEISARHPELQKCIARSVKGK